MGDLPVALLYIVLALLTLGTGIGVLVYQTGASSRAVVQRRANVFGGVLLVLFGGAVLVLQLAGVLAGTYTL